ncbi:protein ADP-ribosylarginine hydrolase-like [Acanthaster planci]|uniref:Protein ADP-ribosylarginine hydrolase-like n=1 Tax=Acanthaster planci TaxID=133434 RepID=A0A8B7Z0M7_ACAPL|nr:protein ADP-ribosylarginine hydrolase-like [Acanthaster planci]
MATMTSLEAYQAALILSGTGDALGLGCKNEGSPSGAEVQQSMSSMGGVDKIEVKPPKWPVGQNTVLHLATAEALATGRTSETLWPEFAAQYVDCMSARMMENRRPSTSLLRATALLRPAEPQGWELPFDVSRTAVEACPAVRSVCIGLRFHKPGQLGCLISTAVECARITHHHPTAYLGAVTSALFTSYAVQRREVREWAAALLDVIPEVLGYVVSTGRDVDDNQGAWCYFGDIWKKYVSMRGISDGESAPRFPRRYGAERRDEAYRHFAMDNMVPGSCGHDAPLIAYDALLSSNSWRDLCDRAVFHCGEGSSSGAIAASWWGLIHGLSGVPPGNHAQVEFRDRLVEAGTKLFALSF